MKRVKNEIIPDIDSSQSWICFFVVMPQSRFKVVWSSLILLIVTFIIVFVPFDLAFLGRNLEDSFNLKIFNCFIELLFIVDAFLSLFSAFERADGFVETRLL